MDSNQKYLIIITLIDGQNFTVPDGAPDRIEATVFAEARFGNESILRSDPIKLASSNPEFVTELAWQLDKKSLHQLRVERKAIKLQVFMQTKERRKPTRGAVESVENGFHSHESDESNRVELIGYTILDIRGAQEREQPKFQWLPLLNPKFRKSSYNRPEVQLAITLSRIDEEADNGERPTNKCQAVRNEGRPLQAETSNASSLEFSGDDSLNDSKMYKTCLDNTLNSNQDDKQHHDEALENDIKIIAKDECIYVFDTQNLRKSTLEDCDERYRIQVTIPFHSYLNFLVKKSSEQYYFSVSLFGICHRTKSFEDDSSVEQKKVCFNIMTTHSGILTTYFDLHSNLTIKLHQTSGEALAFTNIQLDQLCDLDGKCRSIEGVFALQNVSDENNSPLSPVQPSIGVSVVLEKLTSGEGKTPTMDSNMVDQHLEMAREHFGPDYSDFLYKTMMMNDTNQLTFDTHQLTTDKSFTENGLDPSQCMDDKPIEELGAMVDEDENRHFCFTIDLKSFSYTPEQRLIPTLRELVVRYSYPFFGYKDPITTDASVPINPSSSIIVAGFCEFNFATTTEALMVALNEVPLNLEIISCDQTRLLDSERDQAERKVGTCSINLADTLKLGEDSSVISRERHVDATTSEPIYGLEGKIVGQLQIYLCLKDLGPRSNEVIAGDPPALTDVADSKDSDKASQELMSQKLDALIIETKKGIETWKEDLEVKLAEDMRQRESERFRRLCHRLEARDAKREQDFKKKMEELGSLEKRWNNSLSILESFEQNLTNTFEEFRAKDVLLDTKLDTLDLKFSKAIIDVKREFERRLNPPATNFYPRATSDIPTDLNRQTKFAQELSRRRPSLQTQTGAVGIPVSIRSSSLVRASNSGPTRLVKQPTGVVTKVVNGSRPRSNSTRLTLSKETQAKLASLRKERADLLRRGCKPNDELIQEINSLIENLAC